MNTKTQSKFKNKYGEHTICENCYPVWDRSNNLKHIGLCDFHKAAPELLEALKRLVNLHNRLGTSAEMETYWNAQSAIRKAEGGAA